MEKTIPITEAKAKPIAVADQVASTGEAIGGSVTFLVDEAELIYAPLGDWDADSA